MGPPWALAFLSALLVTLVGTPFLRQLARSTNFVDKPADRKSHHIPVPYLGGIGLMAGVLVGLAFAPSLSPPMEVIALGGPFIGAMGLLDDHRTVNPYYRFAIELGVAAMALAAGVRIHATDLPVIDGFFTLVWIVGITNAVNFLDNMDGLSAGVAAAGALGVLALAVLGEQAPAATLAAGVVGACLGFLAYNRRPASIFMGDAGSLFLGFALAVIAIDVSPALRPPASFAVPMVLLALPVLDTSTVTLARLRRGRSVLLGGKDHLSHRLVKLGLSPGAAVGVLIGVELLVAALAVLAGRGVVPLAVAIGGAALVLGGLTVIAARADVYEEPVVGLPHRLKLAAVAGVGGAALVAAPALIALVRSIDPAHAGTRAVQAGLASLAAGDGGHATTLFDEAASDFDRADHALRGPVTSLSLALPVVRSNLSASRTVVAVGQDVAAEASRLTTLAEASNLRLGGGSDPAGEAARLAPDLAASESTLHGLADRLAGADRPYLWPSLKHTLRDLRSRLSRQSAAADVAAETARTVPALLGANGSRRYFLAIQDNAELRGTGGVVRVWAELVAEEGKVRVTRVGSPDELNRAHTDSPALEAPDGFLDRYSEFDVAGTWQNVNVSPDFSVTGQVISALYAQSGGQKVDGVIAVDLRGLAALLDLTGPIRVDGWPDPVTGANVLDAVTVASNDRLSPADRDTFLASLARTSAQAFAAADLGTPRRLARSLQEVVSGGHLLLYAAAPAEEDLLQRLGAAGTVAPVAGDSLLVVNQNLSGSAIDSFLRRQVRYDLNVDPGRQPAVVTGTIGVTLTNDAPPAGLPPAVIGPHDPRFSAGENRTYLSVYTPSALGGGSADVRADREFGRLCYSAVVSVPPRQSRTVELDVQGRVQVGGGWYTLDLPHQPSLTPDDTHVSLTVPAGWRIAEARGMRIDGPRHAVADVEVGQHQQVSVRLQRTPWSRLWYHPRA